MLIAWTSALCALPPGVYTPSQFDELVAAGRAKIVNTVPAREHRVQAPPPGYNETYGYPDGIGGMIVEGPFPYHKGPPSWSEANPTGAYGMILAAGTLSTGGECTPLPKDSPFVGSAKVKPVPLTNSLKNCLLGCPLAEVNATGVDPCHAGDMSDPSNSPMGCYDLGPGTVQGGGACGYNCSAWQYKRTDKLVPCHNQSEISLCMIYCDSRTFPTKTAVLS